LIFFMAADFLTQWTLVVFAFQQRDWQCDRKSAECVGNYSDVLGVNRNGCRPDESDPRFLDALGKTMCTAQEILRIAK
jgi:hypothetical protein